MTGGNTEAHPVSTCSTEDDAWPMSPDSMLDRATKASTDVTWSAPCLWLSGAQRLPRPEHCCQAHPAAALLVDTCIHFRKALPWDCWLRPAWGIEFDFHGQRALIEA